MAQYTIEKTFDLMDMFDDLTLAEQERFVAEAIGYMTTSQQRSLINQLDDDFIQMIINR